MPQFDETFWTSEGRRLLKPEFLCLTQDAGLYQTLLLQIREDISYDETGIWLTDDARSRTKFKSFFMLAAERHVELAVTPEYSCPWSVIGDLIHDDSLPEMQRLWIVGCQSISAQALHNFINTHPQVIWVYEHELVQSHLNDQQFFDPVCLLFRTEDANGEGRSVVVIQFKNQFFGGGGFTWEQENMIRGTKFYVLSNRTASTKLIVQICSDALLDINFPSVEDGRFLNDPLLLVHIQLNQSPFQANYKNYRTSVFKTGGKDLNKEVLCLNWARGVRDNDGTEWNTYGGSALYIKSEKLNLTDQRFNSNHAFGLYYSNWYDRRSHIYFLGYDEHVYLLRGTKPSQLRADGSQMQRSGPQLIALYHWDNGWQTSISADDGFATLCLDLQNEAGDLSCIAGNPLPLDVERLVELSLGMLDPAGDWSRPEKLSAMKVSDDELNNRTNFTHDPATLQAEARTRKLLHYGFLKNAILTVPDKLPQGLRDAQLGYDQTLPLHKRYLLNLHSVSNNLNRGTGVFLGASTHVKACSVRDRVVNLLKDDQQGKRVIIWYQTHAGLISLSPEQKPEIAENTSRESNSYKKTRP
nr:hypothetical protein [uncultured Dyadobacter sp.]